MVRWSGSADLEFQDSALLAFARAAELAETDVHERHTGAWAIEDRRITFSLDIETGRPELEAMRRFLALLALQAVSGEAVIEVAFPPEHWRSCSAAPSFANALVVIDGIGTAEDEGPASETIRSAAS